MDIRTRNTEAYTAEAGNTRLDALNGALKAEDIAVKEDTFAKNKKPAQAGQSLTRAGRILTNRGKNAMNEAASQECDSEDAGAYATDKVTDKAKEAALRTGARTKQGAQRTVDKVREEIRARRKERRQSRSAEGQFSGGEEYGRRFHGPEYAESGGNSVSRGRSGQGGASRTERGGYRFAADTHNSGTGGRYAGTESGDLSASGTGSRFSGTEGGVKADAPKENARFCIQEKPDMSIRLRDSSVRSAEHRIRTSAKQAGEAAKKAKKAAKAARKAAQRAAREAAKTAAKTTEKAAKATAKTAKAVGKALFKAVSAVIEKIVAACASGGPFVLIIILAAVYIGVIMCKIGDVADKLLSVFSLGGAIVWEGDVENLEEMIADAHLEPNPAITALNESYHNRLDRIIRNNKHDEVVLENPDPDWGDILGFWAAWQLCVNDGEFPDLANSGMEGLPQVFADMVTVEFEVTEGSSGYGSGSGVSSDSGNTEGSWDGDSGNGGAVHTGENKEDGDKAEPDEEKENENLILTITVKQRSIEEMAELYELGEDGEDYIELMSEGSLFEVINILTKYIEGYEMPEDTEEPEEGEESGGGHPGGGGSF